MTYSRTGIFIQARSNSSRLKNKIYAGIPNNDSTCQLMHIYERMLAVECDVVSILIPDNDMLLQNWCLENQVEFFCGPELDVRNRYRMAARHYNVDWIGRATGDNPCVDTKIAQESFLGAIKNDLDLFSFDNLPLGIAIEVFKKDALNQDTLSDTCDYREHVSLHIKHNPGHFNFRHARHPAMAEFDEIPIPRLTVDTAEDLEVVRNVFMHLGYRFDLKDVLELCKKEPKLFHKNKHVEQITFCVQ